jgi:hypothetical protein
MQVAANSHARPKSPAAEAAGSGHVQRAIARAFRCCPGPCSGWTLGDPSLAYGRANGSELSKRDSSRERPPSAASPFGTKQKTI